MSRPGTSGDSIYIFLTSGESMHFSLGYPPRRRLRFLVTGRPRGGATKAVQRLSLGDHGVRVQLAVQLSAADHHKEALEHLLTVLRSDRDWNNGEAKRLYLDTLTTIGKGDPLAAEYQRKLFSTKC